ncbi:MAG: phospholipase D-like domain-containing protein [Microcoleaceae cyanobacterium]
MFLKSFPKSIDPQLIDLVEQIEKQSSSFSVLAASQFNYRVWQTPIEVTITAPRKFNLLEELILSAGIELNPPAKVNELATVLGLDSVFVKNTINTLRDLQTLERNPEILLTPQGREFYQQGSVPQPPKTEQIYLIIEPLQGNLFFVSEPIETTKLELPDFGNFVSIYNRFSDSISLDIEELQQLIQASGLRLHIPEDGKIVTGSQVVGESEDIWQTMSLFVLFDVLSDKVILQVRRGKKILESASKFLNEMLEKEAVDLQNLCELSDEAILNERQLLLEQRNRKIEERIEKIQQQAVELIKANQTNETQKKFPDSQEKGEVVLLRDRQIRQVFLECLKSAKHNILIFSPWVSQEVIDEEFISLLQNCANRGVWIIIGHGISRKQEQEDRPISPEVEAKLKEVKTREGLSAVQIFWLGNSHAKEVVVDGKIHLCGSHNWLSYRGDRLPRGETVYQVTIPTQVREASHFLVGRFQSHAHKLWNQTLSNLDEQKSSDSLCIWGGLGMEKKALQELQKNHRLELLPVWLKVVCQGLRAKKISPDSDIFPTGFSLLGEISEKNQNIDSLREGLQKIIGIIASQNPQIALNILSDEIWGEFIRLGVAESFVDSPDKFISKYTVKQPQINSKSPGKKNKKRKY